MIIYFFIPQISKTNGDRGWEPERKSGKREQKLKRQSFVVNYCQKSSQKPAPNRVFLFSFKLHRGSKQILYARKRKFVLSIDTDEIGYLSKSVTLEVMNDMT